VGLNQLPVNKDAVLLWTEACQKELAPLFDNDVMPFVSADGEFGSALI
jgi:hypothetical protein